MPFFGLLPMILCVLCLPRSQAQNVTYEVRKLEGLLTADPLARGGVSPTPFIIRQNLPGRVVFQESSRFWIEMRIRVPDGRNTSEVKTEYKLTPDNETVLLQVYALDTPERLVNESKDQLVLIIGATTGGFLALCVLVTLLIYCCWWKPKHAQTGKADINGDNSTAKDSVKVQHPATFSQKRRFYDTSGSGSTLNVAMVFAIATACVVHAQMTSPVVDITVHTPPGMLRQDSRVLVKSAHKNIVEVNVTNTKISVYDVPSVAAYSTDLCHANTTCHMGTCDPLTGKCACARGRRLKRPESDRCVYECEKSCPSGTFEVSPCNETHAAVCQKCRPLCSFSEFESTACAGNTDRNCTDISKLPLIKVSPNVLFEDLSMVTDDVIVTKDVAKNLSGHHDVWLNRSSGIAIRVRLLRMDFSTTFRQVDHHSNDNAKFKTLPGSKEILDGFCRHPLPDFYTARIKDFQEIDVRKDNFNVECPTYPQTASKRKPSTGDGMFCPGVNNSMVGLFGRRPASDKFKKVEKSAACHKLMLGCSTCRDTCAQHVRSIPGCNQTSEYDISIGKHKYSEHFSYCFDCCFVQNCTCPTCSCKKYEMDCLGSRVTCVHVKEYQITLDPSFPSAGDFRCHVEVALGPKFVINTTLWKDGSAVYGVTSREQNLTRKPDGKSTHDFGYMTLSHPTVFQTKQSKDLLIISGNTKNSRFDIGWFNHEADLTNTLASGGAKSSFHAQPRRPFGINTDSWKNRQCDAEQSKDFVLVANKVSHKNLQSFQNLSAELDWQDSRKVYKVFYKKSSRRISLRVPRTRSVLRSMFPQTAIMNDASLQGSLIRNRTFWTLRIVGRLEECPGAFNIKLFDQDRPTVEVYNYDSALTDSDCNFVVEFHLPSGGDTNLIDKQFLIKMTDSKRVIQLILVSPRFIPNFKLPEIDNEIDLDRILKLVLPFAYALAGMLVLLVSILIYGYKTRPKDKTQRDRDSKLHFRHILFVIWFVGMRLVKSFLLTLTLLLVMFSAIHHSNVKVLNRYSEFRAQRDKIEKDLTAKMDSHKVQEINRQLGYLEKGKEVCDKKLQEVDALIDAYFKEMRRRLIEDMKKKSIIYAAYKRIEKRFKEAKEKFRTAREEFNRALRTLTDEINDKIQQIRDKIENNFWLKAAKILYKILDGIGRIFGSGLGPFIDWVNLNVGFPKFGFSLGSFKTFFDEFLKAFKVPNLDFDVNLKYNFSGFNFKLPNKSFSLKLAELNLPKLNISSPVSKDRLKELLVLDWVVSLFKSGVIGGILLILDILWFVYRHSKTYQTAVMLLHGLPVIYDLHDIKKEDKKKRKKEEKKRLKASKETLTESTERVADPEAIEVLEEGNDDVSSSNKNMDRKGKDQDDRDKETKGPSKADNGDDVKEEEGEENASGKSKGKKAMRHGMKGLGFLNEAAFFVFNQLKKLNYQVTKTNLVPMCLLIVMGLLLIYVAIVTAKYALTVKTLDILGYFDVKMAPILTTRKIVNTRITSNAFMVNEVQLPYYEKRVNARIAFARKKAEFFKGFQCTTADLHNKEYCFWVDGECDRVKSFTDEFLQNLTKLECHIPAVIPRRFTKFDRILYKQQLMRGINPYVTAARSLILNTFYTILVILGIFLLLMLIGEVLMFILTRLDLVRTVKTYQLGKPIERTPETERDVPKVGRLKIPDAIRKECGGGEVEGERRKGWHLEWLPEVAKTLNKPKKDKKEKGKDKNRDKAEEMELKDFEKRKQGKSRKKEKKGDKFADEKV